MPPVHSARHFWSSLCMPPCPASTRNEKRFRPGPESWWSLSCVCLGGFLLVRWVVCRVVGGVVIRVVVLWPSGAGARRGCPQMRFRRLRGGCNRKRAPSVDRWVWRDIMYRYTQKTYGLGSSCGVSEFCFSGSGSGLCLGF